MDSLSNCRSSFSKNAHLAYATLLLKWVSSWILPIYALQFCFHGVRKWKERSRLLKFLTFAVQLCCSFNWIKGWTKSGANSFCRPWSEFSSLLYPAIAISREIPSLTFLELTDRWRWHSRFWLKIPGTRCNRFSCILFQHSIIAAFPALQFYCLHHFF